MNIIPKALIRRILPTVAKLSLLGLLSLSGQANAATSAIPDSAIFFAALPGSSSTQDFEGFNRFSNFNDRLVDDITYSPIVDENTPGADLAIFDSVDTTSGNNYLGNDAGNDFTFFSGDELSFGFSSLAQAFGLVVIGSPANVIENYFLLAAGGSSVFNLATPEQTLSDGGEVFFIGLINTDGFNSAQLFSFGDPNNPFFIFNVDDVTTVAAAVPEPSSYLLLSLDLFVLGKKWHSEKLDILRANSDADFIDGSFFLKVKALVTQYLTIIKVGRIIKS